jgi:dipeptidyl aminopeptidase/acylaminoacyl peptidase
MGNRSNMVWLYLPKNRPAGKLPVILIAPAGSRMFHGMDLGDGDRAEHFPYVRAGYAVVAYAVDGHLQENPSDNQLVQAVRSFQASEAGVTNAKTALTFALQQVPGLDANRVYTAGHSSAATISLVVAASDPRIKGCIAFAPVCNVPAHLGKELIRDITPASPGFDRFVQRASPHQVAPNLRCPVFLFRADDDSNVSPAEISQFAATLAKTNSRVTLARVATGNHYDSMIRQGIPQALRWLGSLKASTGTSGKAVRISSGQ